MFIDPEHYYDFLVSCALFLKTLFLTSTWSIYVSFHVTCMNISVNMCTTVLEATSCAVELQCTCLLNTHRLYSVSFSFWEACMFSGMVLRTSYYIVVSRTYVNLIDNKMDVCRLRLLTQCNQYTATASMCWSCIMRVLYFSSFHFCVLLFTFVFLSQFP
mgnify:CR=1 FL=1